MIALLASLLCFAQEVRAVAAPAPVERPLPAGSELRLHDASASSGHAALVSALAALQAGRGAADELARLTELRREAEETAEGMALAMSARLSLADGQKLTHLGEGRLALLGTSEQQVRLAAALGEAVQFSGHIEVETRLYFGTDAELPAQAFDPGLVLAEPAARALGERLARSSRELVTAPLVVVRPWRESRLSTLDKVPYVKDYEITTVPNLDTEILDPVIDVLELGVEITLRCAPADGNRIGLLTELAHRRLRAPLRDFETTIGRSGTRVTVQLADVLRVGFSGYFELGEGETLALAAGPPEERVVALVRARRVPAGR
ncbi:MAG: hypothetical protein ABL998_10030 [Planctomycetota bacterium]